VFCYANFGLRVLAVTANSSGSVKVLGGMVGPLRSDPIFTARFCVKRGLQNINIALQQTLLRCVHIRYLF